MTNDINTLVNKLSAFHRKYHFFRFLKGIVFCIAVLTLLITAFLLLEYTFYMPGEIRKFMVFGLSSFALLIVCGFVFLPLFQLMRGLRPGDLRKANRLITSHFSEIKDKLLNVIELADIQKTQNDNELVIASINQKIEELKPFDFNKAISYKGLRYVLISLITSGLVAVLLYLVDNDIYTDPANRIIHYNETFERPAPFKYQLLNASLKVKKGESCTLEVETSGEELPSVLYINIEGNNFLMQRSQKGIFRFEVNSVINGFQFYFTDLQYNSKNYKIELLPKPGIENFSVEVVPPAYTAIKSSNFENLGDLQIAQGSRVTWNFKTVDVDTLLLSFNDSLNVRAAERNGIHYVKKKIFASNNYNVLIQNKITEPELALSYNIEVTPDLFPEIDVMEVQDSISITRFFFKGMVSDDYGFSKLRFHYNINNADSTISIPILKGTTEQDFYYSFDFSEIENPQGVITYYFSVTDNDAVNGNKTTTSKSFTFQYPNQEQIEQFDKEQFANLESMLEESQKLAGEIQKDLKNLQMKNMDTNISGWEKSQMANDIIQKQNKLEQLYDQIKQDNERLNSYLNSFSGQNEELVEKQKQIQELLEEVFTDELQKLMDEFNKLAEEFDSKKFNELTKDMNLGFDDLQKQLDRNLEMLRKMKMEQQLQEVIDELNEMAENQEKLSRDVKENKNFEQTDDAVEKDSERLKKLQEKVNETLDKNKELEKPLNFDSFEEEFSDLQKSMEDTQEQLQNKKRKKSSEQLQKNSDKMENLAFAMQQMLDMNEQQQNAENLQNLKQILNNLMYISFRQEDILKALQQITSKDPLIITLNKDQNHIIDQSAIVKDSLYALALRTPHISSTINNEIISLELNMNKAAEQMEEGQFPAARGKQQFAITAANNLALLLNEALDNLEKMQANKQPGDQQCENPGGGKPGLGKLKESSQSIKEQLQKMIEQMKKGNPQGMGKQLGQSLMQHEMMQQAIREIMNNGTVGSSAQETLKQIDRMLEQNRKDLMNRSVSANTIKRQNMITTRLLEAERAEMERDFEDKRESKSAEEFYSNPSEFFEFKKKDQFSIEYINKNSHKLNNFYNQKYKQYLDNMRKEE